MSLKWCPVPCSLCDLLCFVKGVAEEKECSFVVSVGPAFTIVAPWRRRGGGGLYKYRLNHREGAKGAQKTGNMGAGSQGQQRARGRRATRCGVRHHK